MYLNIHHFLKDCEKSLEQLNVRYDAALKAVYFAMSPAPLPSFTPRLLSDISLFQKKVARFVEQHQKCASEQPVEYLIFSSDVPSVFNLGGDLEFFVNMITSGDRKQLSDYARLSIDVLHSNYANLDLPVTTISLIKGTTLGAGFEAALSSDFIIAEEGAQIGFPEVVFNMFPGMGAYSFLGRRLESGKVERMILTGKLYDSEHFYDEGVIDVLCAPGEAEQGLQNFVRRHRKARVTHQAVLAMRNRVHPVCKQELLDIAELWVDSAFSLSKRDLSAMSRLVKAQSRRMSVPPVQAEVDLPMAASA